MLKQGNGNDDPRLCVYKYQVFAYASTFLSKYLDFGYSLPLLLSQAYSYLKSHKIVHDITNYILLNGLAIALKDLMPILSRRIFITNELSQEDNPLRYHFISEYLLKSKNFKLVLEYDKAEQLYDCNNVGDI